MATNYIAQEVAKILEEKKDQYPDNLALASAWVLAHFKGINIKIYDAKNASSLCDYNVIASAENTTQAKSMVDTLLKVLKDNEFQIVSLEGVSEGEWILLDVGDVIIHIFQDISRDIFDLDSLWRDGNQLPIPPEYYYGPSKDEESPESSKKGSPINYF